MTPVKLTEACERCGVEFEPSGPSFVAGILACDNCLDLMLWADAIEVGQ